MGSACSKKNAAASKNKSAAQITQDQAKQQAEEESTFIKLLVDEKYFSKEQYEKIHNAIIQAREMVQKLKNLPEQYIQGKVLGQGAFAKVVQAVDRQSSQEYAIKITKKKDNVMKLQMDIIKEVAILILLANHSHVVKMYGAFQDVINCYIVMELCDGGELFDVIVKMKQFSEEQALAVTKQLIDFIFFCHDSGVVHRDLKPENILLRSYQKGQKESEQKFQVLNNEMITKVVDFGTSDFCGEGQRLTKKFGTPYYVAPEVLKKDYDKSIDIWSVGVILYIMLCGYPPFRGKTDEQIIQNVMQGKVSFEGEEWMAISPQTLDLLQKMLTQPSKRWTPSQLLKHPVFHPNFERKYTILGNHIIRRLQSFSRLNDLKKLSLMLVGQTLSDKEVMALRQIFEKFDSGGTGEINFQELKNCLATIGSSIEEEEWQQILQLCDRNTDGKVDYNSFVAAMLDRTRMVRRRDMLRRSFDLLDKDKDGFLGPKDIVQATQNKVSLEQANELITEYIPTGETKLNYEQFYNMLATN